MADSDRSYVLDKMKSRTMRIEDFDYERLSAPPLYSLLSVDDVNQLHKLATSIRYAARPVERMQEIDKIMRSRGFRKMTGGTNRAVYKFLEDTSFVVKVATDAVGVGDSPREFINQQHIKPFCCKVFEVSQCGTVGVFERLIPITSREEFFSLSDQAYMLISQWLTGEYVMDDIGSQFFMNYGIRPGFGLCILDFPYSYKLDGNKLFCNVQQEDGSFCGGVIDYDEGYNHLYCTKCGKRYRAQELAESIKNDTVIIKGGSSRMKVKFGRGDDMVTVDGSDKMFDTTPKIVGRRKGKKAKVGTLKVKINGESVDVDEYNHPEEESNLKARGARGTILHAQMSQVSYEPEEGVVVTAGDPPVDYFTEGSVESGDISYSDHTDAIVEDSAHTNAVLTDSTSTSGITFNPDGYKNLTADIVKLSADIVGSKDLDPNEDGARWLLIEGISGPTKYVITQIMDKPITDLSIVTKEAYNKVTASITDLTSKNEDLVRTLSDYEELRETYNRLQKAYETMEADYKVREEEAIQAIKDLDIATKDIKAANEEIERLKSELANSETEYNQLVDDYNNLSDERDTVVAEKLEAQKECNILQAKVDAYEEEKKVAEAADLPYFLDANGRKREKGTNKFYSEKKATDDFVEEFDTSSPLISEEPVAEVEATEVVVEEVPVGAAPVKKTTQRKGSVRYDANSDYYKTPNRNVKKKSNKK